MEKIAHALEELLQGNMDAALAVLGDTAEPSAARLRQLVRRLSEGRAYAEALAQGCLAVRPPDQGAGLFAPLEQLHSKLQRLSRQLVLASMDYPVFPVTDLGDLSDGLNMLFASARNNRRQAEHDRNYDAETGLLNRKAFIRKVQGLIQARPDKVGILLSCGLDNLRYVNDAHGYDHGDAYIGKVVEILRSCEATSVLLGRPAGDEFALYAHGFDDEESALRFAQDNRKALLNTKMEFPGETIKIRASWGAAIYPCDAETGDVLMNYATHAMFSVQSRNRGTFMRFNLQVYRSKSSMLSRQERLDELLEGKLIRFAFQPIVSLRDGAVFGYEALMRSMTPHFPSPLDILQLAEAQSKLPQLEYMTFKVIFDWMAQHMNMLGARKIFFNTISAQYFSADEMRALHPSYEDISRRMVFEIIETVGMENDMMRRIQRFRREFSSLIAIDDFGCAHSNAFRLLRLAPEVLKVDSVFIRSLHKASAARKELLANLLRYCRAKDILTVAEGVETCEELESAARMGFDLCQGFYLGRPEFYLQEISPMRVAEVRRIAAAVS